MKKYKKPIVLINEDLAEGVYAASGSQCYAIDAYIAQSPTIGRGDYRIQLNAVHNADHTNDAQILTIKFNQSVKYVSSNGILVYGDDTNTLVVNFSYWQNEYDKVGLGELVVTSNEGLEIVNVKLAD